MFQEILQGIVGIVNVLNISDKTTSLTDKHKKKKLGRQLRKLYESISRSIEYAKKIEDVLKKIINVQQDDFENQKKMLCNYLLPELGEFLNKQKYELLEFKKIIWIWNEEEDTYLSLLIEIYGNDMESEFDKISAWKYSFID